MARQNAPGFGTKSFDAGERLQLKHVGYSPYDSSHVYTFETGDGGEKSYGLRDDRPIALLRSVFELSGGTADRG